MAAAPGAAAPASTAIATRTHASIECVLIGDLLPDCVAPSARFHDRAHPSTARARRRLRTQRGGERTRARSSGPPEDREKLAASSRAVHPESPVRAHAPLLRLE